MKFKKISSKKWFNTEILKEKDFSGRVVLVNFWTLSCVNSIRSFPRIREIWNKFKDKKFIVVSVHTPQFDFEKSPDCVRRAAIANNIFWPIAIDNDWKNWNRFKNRYWPTNYLISKKGEVVYCHMGEGEYSKLEKMIQKLLYERSSKAKYSEMFTEKTNNVCYCATPDISCGYMKGDIVNSTGYLSNRNAIYDKPKNIPLHKMALDGGFFAMPEYIQCQKVGSLIYMNFTAIELNMMMEPFGKEADVEVRLEGEVIPSEIRGADVDEFGNIHIDQYKNYNILKTDFPVSGILSLTLKKGKYKAHNLTFSGCVKRSEMEQ